MMRLHEKKPKNICIIKNKSLSLVKNRRQENSNSNEFQTIKP